MKPENFTECQPKVKEIGKVLTDNEKTLSERYRALFALRNIGGEDAIDYISEAFEDPSALLKHELAYCLGQMGDQRAVPILTTILKDKSQAPMVRHEAAEALGALASKSATEVLEEFASDPIQEVSETCELALRRIKWVEENNTETVSPYESIDPTPAASSKNVTELETILLNEKAPLFERYKAMFALRNLNTKESIESLCKGLNSGSSLFRHEIGFVLGQLQSPHSISALASALEDTNQNEMVRHECAEALGSIATDEAVFILNNYLFDDNTVVRESCSIALDMADYERCSDFQYANTASKV